MPLMVGWIISAVMWLFKSRIGFFITTLLIWLGINYGTVTLVLDPIIDAIKGYSMGMDGTSEIGSKAFEWLAYLKFDKALTMLFSAYATKHAVASGRMFLFRRGVGAA